MRTVTILFYALNFFLLTVNTNLCFAGNEPADLTIRWEKVGKEAYFGKLGFYPSNSFLRSELYLFRFKLEHYKIMLVEASQVLSKPRGMVEDMVQKTGGFAGINANFFDTEGSPLGLMIPATREANKKVQLGGRLLTGVFSIRDGLPSVVSRSTFNSDKVEFALQAGPILYLKGTPTRFNSPSQTSRRSGMAVTKSNEVVIFSTLLRFPGTSLEDMQGVLGKTGLEIMDALNLDGGGSSQFYLKPSQKREKIFISGGDEVPVALVVRRDKSSTQEQE